MVRFVFFNYSGLEKATVLNDTFMISISKELSKTVFKSFLQNFQVRYDKKCKDGPKTISMYFKSFEKFLITSNTTKELILCLYNNHNSMNYIFFNKVSVNYIHI